MRKLLNLVAIGFFLVASHAVAEVPNSDRIVISANDLTATEFPSDFHALDQSFAESGESVNTFSFFIGNRSPTHNATYNTAVELTDPSGAISDIVELSIVSTDGVQAWTLNFFSDTEGGAALQHLTGLVGPAAQVQETGGLQDISDLFLNSRGTEREIPLFNVFVQSDLAAAVPEPEIYAMMGIGLALMGFVRVAKRAGGCVRRLYSWQKPLPTQGGGRVLGVLHNGRRICARAVRSILVEAAPVPSTQKFY